MDPIDQFNKWLKFYQHIVNTEADINVLRSEFKALIIEATVFSEKFEKVATTLGFKD